MPGVIELVEFVSTDEFPEMTGVTSLFGICLATLVSLGGKVFREGDEFLRFNERRRLCRSGVV